MSASSVDTAELPRVTTSTHVARTARTDSLASLLSDLPDVPLAPEFIPLHDAAMATTGTEPDAGLLGRRLDPFDGGEAARPPLLVAVPGTPAVPGVQCGRAERRQERRQARRQRLLLAVLGIVVMAATLAATVVVLGMSR